MRASLLLIVCFMCLGAVFAPAAAVQTGATSPDSAPENAASNQPDDEPDDEPDDAADDAAPAPLPEVVLIMKGGERLTGLLVSRDDYVYVLRISGVDVRVPRDDVEHMVLQRPVEERYREIRALIEDDDVERLLQLVEWLRERALLDEAMAETEHILAIKPENADALRLRLLIARLIALRDGDAPDDEDSPQRKPGERAPRHHPDDRAFPLLTEEQINLIKIYEVDLNKPPRMIIQRDTVERLLERYSDHPLIPTTREGRAAFHRKPAHEILDVMFRVRARDLYPEIRILGHPDSLSRFRDTVNRGWFVTSCASSACHGGDAAGSFMVYNRRPNNDDAFLTNFLILERHHISSGAPMINYDVPERSALLQLGLPREDSAHPHPDVRGWKPVFRNAQDKRFRETIDWIMSMYTPRPEHPVDFTPPGGAAAPSPDPVER